MGQEHEQISPQARQLLDLLPSEHRVMLFVRYTFAKEASSHSHTLPSASSFIFSFLN